METLISVIVPCYNQAPYLDECLQSVLNQTHQNWECIIINDGSTDNSEEIIRKWCKEDSRFKYFYKNNSGVTDTRNFGIENSVGSYIAFLDGDDVLIPDSLEIRLSTLLNKNVDLVYSYAYAINGREYTKKASRSIDIGKMEGINGIESFLNNNSIVTSSVLCKKGSLQSIGNFNWYKNAEDLYCWLEMLLNNVTFYGMKEYTVYYRNLDVSLSSVDRRCMKEIIEFIEILKPRLIQYGVNYSKYLNLWIRRHILREDEKRNILTNIKSRIEYVNTIVPSYFPKYLIYLPLSEKLTKILAIRIMNAKKNKNYVQ